MTSFYIAVSGWQEASTVGLFAFIELILNVACGTRCVPILTGTAPCLDVTAIFYQMVKQAFKFELAGVGRG